MKTLQQIFEDEAQRTFPFRARWNAREHIETFIGFGLDGSMLSEEELGPFWRFDPNQEGWIFIPPEIKKPRMIAWLHKFSHTVGLYEPEDNPNGPILTDAWTRAPWLDEPEAVKP